MKRLSLLILALFLFSVISVSALNADDAKQDWIDAKEARLEADTAYKEAKIDYARNPSDENDEKVLETTKELMYAVLDEVEAWLTWKKLEAQQNEDVPDDLEDKIEADVDKNLEVVEEIRGDVDKIENRAGAGLVFLKMLAKYGELLTDVSRNSGYVWVHIANEKADKIEEYEAKLRDATDDEELLEKLDVAKDELETARDKIDLAEKAYDDVQVGNKPFINFAEGNAYLRQARSNLINAYVQLEHVYQEIVREE